MNHEEYEPGCERCEALEDAVQILSGDAAIDAGHDGYVILEHAIFHILNKGC